MKKLIIFALLLVLSFSCDKKEQEIKPSSKNKILKNKLTDLDGDIPDGVKIPFISDDGNPAFERACTADEIKAGFSTLRIERAYLESLPNKGMGTRVHFSNGCDAWHAYGTWIAGEDACTKCSAP